MQVGSDANGGLAVRGDKGGDNLLSTIDSNRVVKGLCASNYYIPMNFFNTYTCNQLNHFGVQGIKSWVDSIDWHKNYNNYDNLDPSSQVEIQNSMSQASSVLLLRNWKEVSKLFIDYIQKSPSSPFKRVGGIFTRYEYQKDVGNLSHIHLILQVKWDEIDDEEKAFVKNLIRASNSEIVKPEEVESLIDEGFFKNLEDWLDMQKHGENVLPHICNKRCQRRVGSTGGSEDTKCRKINNNRISKDCTKDTFMVLPQNWSKDCIDRLIMIGLAEVVTVGENDNDIKFNDSFFTPKRHIPHTMNTHDVNMSPVEGKTFSVCRSMQNLQMLTDCGGVNKYVCKYIGKIDEQNYVVLHVDGRGQLVTKGQFLHNTKITSSKKNEDDAREKRRDRNHPQGRAVSQNEMVDLLLQYPEIMTNLNFIHVSTLPLEFRAGTEKKGVTTMTQTNAHTQRNVYNTVEDSARTDNFVAARVREQIPGLLGWRLHTFSERMTFESVHACRLSVDKVSKFSLRPCEFRKAFPQMREYYRFHEYVGVCTEEKMLKCVCADIRKTYFIDGLMNQVKVRKEALDEVIEYLQNEVQIQRETDDSYEAVETMFDLFFDIRRVLNANDNDLDNIDGEFKAHVQGNLVVSHGKFYTLPTPVFSYTKPSTGVQFILHILLSLGKFDTEIDLTLHCSLKESFRYAKLIGSSNEPEDLRRYSNELLLRYFKKQVVTFPNTKYILQSWIVEAAELFDSIIIDDELTISDLPAVQQSALFNEINARNELFLTKVRSKVIDAALREMGNATIENCAIPLKEELMNATKENPINWDPVGNFTRPEWQPIESFDEQKSAIMFCMEAMNNYLDFGNKFVKCTGIRGAAGSGKAWTMLYLLIYALSQGLTVITTAHLSRRAVQLGGKHIAYLFGIGFPKSSDTPQRIAELAIQRIMRKPWLANMLRVLDVLFMDELALNSMEMQGILDIILRRIRESDLYMGGVHVQFTLDHLQTKPVKQRPLLISPQIIPCYQMFALRHPIRAASDANFRRIQEISRMNVSVLIEEENNYVREFTELISEHCTFVDTWESPLITEKTYRLYSKRVPAKEASRQYAERVKRCIHHDNYVVSTAVDVEKSRFSHSDWYCASQSSSDQITHRVKEPPELLFFFGGHYEFTFNKEDCFSQSQLAIVYDLPSSNDINVCRKIKVLCAPPGIQDFSIDTQNTTKEEMLEDGFVEVEIGAAPERPIALKSNMQGKRKQYGLRHRVTNTIHGAQGETLPEMATEISQADPNFNIWDRGQMIVLLTRTKRARDTIFVGCKHDTLAALRQLLLTKTQWSDYIEQVLSIVTVNDSVNLPLLPRVMNQNAYPFRVSDLSLPTTRTGFIYFLISVKDRTFTYIGHTICITERLPQHNKGYGSSATCPERLRPYGILSYICGSKLEDESVRLYLERKWKINRDYFIDLGNRDPRVWARDAGIMTINQALENERYSFSADDLKLVCLFRDV